ncbi:MAG: hypothetical protein ATN33_00925 [Epulopiscium sp. Nele67-Bin001]|nr:MAG: hypothetical protein ATN33_00925 [Epulopiscium sp. Nele67-Bin001]
MYSRKKDDGTFEPLKEHLQNVAQLSQQFASNFGAQQLGYEIGLAHDIGKYCAKFQARLTGSTEKVDHSTIGAIEFNELHKNGIGIIGAFVIEGHHKGLSDFGTTANRKEEGFLSPKLKAVQHYRSLIDYDLYKEEIQLKAVTSLPAIESSLFSIYMFTKMLYSSLVDADFLATEKFMVGDRNRGSFDTLSQLNLKLTQYLAKFKAPTNRINKVRTDILNMCLEQSTKPKGVYSLTVPTGAGKTLSALAFAINHAARHNMDRLIFIIPYTSIIDQTAQIFKSIFGDSNVIEHHSQFQPPTDFDIDTHKLATENWDAPIIVTTNVQFFESIFANRSSKCRKLHNVCNSVLVFDETQMLPLDYLKPSVTAIELLVNNYNCTTLLCSATQPALNSLFTKSNITEIVGDIDSEIFNRINIKNLDKLSIDSLVNMLEKHPQVLCIVNTKKFANRLANEDWIYLSTLMYPQHRKEVIKEIRRRLSNNEPCKVVSTSLIEAGVDLDFPVVYRELCGLDSIIQAGGRCNREAKLDKGQLYVFECEPIKDLLMRQYISATKSSLASYDIASDKAMTAYFRTLYNIKGKGLDAKDILGNIEKSKHFDFNFKTIANDFKLIDNDTQMVIIPNDDIATEIKSIKTYGITRQTLRKLSLYAVNVYEHQLKALCVEMICDGIYLLLDMGQYNQVTGLQVEVEEGDGIFI